MSHGEASARVQASVVAKRDGQVLAPSVLRAVVDDYVAGRIPQYQMAAWLATVACRGLDMTELVALTEAYVTGGERLDLGRIDGAVLDKHSTGGVGDKLSLVVVPIVAACGVSVVKMSGRGLGHAGGTIDKLESIPGLRLDLAPEEVYSLVGRVGMVLMSQSDALAPGDDATYSLRDVTGTVESIPLIAASIMSKKVAVGSDGLVLDVKTGAGALITDLDRARELAETMMALADRFELPCRAVLSDMSQPLGYAVGNALEVKEALAVLRGEPVPDLWEAGLVLARLMLQSADPSLSDREADDRATTAVRSGAAHERFMSWTAAQGGDARALEDPARLPGAEHVRHIVAPRSGWVHDLAPRAVGMAAVHVNAGRLSHQAELDHGAGVLLLRRVGDRVEAGDPVAELHYNRGDPDLAARLLEGAYSVSDEAVEPASVIHRVLGGPTP